LSDPIKIYLASAKPVTKALILHYLATLDLGATAKAMQVEKDTVRRRLNEFGLILSFRKQLEGGHPHRIMDGEGTVEAPAPEVVRVEKAEPVRLDLVEKHRYEQSEKLHKAQIKDLTERLAAAEDHRTSILGLTFDPLEPICKPSVYQQGERGKQAAVLHLSDTHDGEVVNLEEMMGVNMFDKSIAEKRFARLFSTATSLTTASWPRSDGAPFRIYILLGGDLISGHGLHPELAETDYGTAYEQCKQAAKNIASGALRWSMECQEHWAAPIEFVFISVPGNHGRSTPGKPRAKLAALQSYDTLVFDFVEAALRPYENFKFYATRAFDAYFDIVGWPTLLTHGDRMSAGGGTGFIGPAANIVKGHKKIMLTEAQQRRPVRFIFSGHYHTRVITPWGFGNGSLVGYSEFAKSIRADAEPAQQNFVVLHEKLGLLREQPIIVGREGEGSIYSPNGGLILPNMEAA
jgi:hypothetical protein